MAEAYRYFGLSCPSGGSFYICQNNATEFIGCCTTDPCTAANNGKCPQKNLRASSFSADTYTDLPRQDCDNEQSIKMWYTCKFNKPPFMGCCASNPCAEGLCVPNDLRPAKLSGESDLKASFLSPGGTSSTSITSSPTDTGVASATSSAAPIVATSTGLSRSAIAGICAGVAVIVIVIVGFVMYRCGWYAKKKDTEKVPPDIIIQSGNPDSSGEPSGLGITDKYRDSYLSGVTAFSHGSPRPDGQYSPGFDAKKLSQYGHYGHASVSSHRPQPPPVELPLTYPAVQELPADHGDHARGSRYLAVSPEPPSSRHSNSPTVTPMSSPRIHDDSTFGQPAPSPGHLSVSGGYYYTPVRAGQTHQGG